MIKWGRKKTFQTTCSASLMPNVSLKTWSLSFKKMKDGAEPGSENARFDDWLYKDDDISHDSDYPLNVSPVSSASFKKMASNGRTMREIISEEQEARKELVPTEAVKKIVFENKTEITIQAAPKDCLKSRSTADNSRTRLGLGEWQKLKNMKINEIMLKNEKQRKSVDGSKETHRNRSKQGRKVNAYTPRTLARVECRIKALEDMKKTRMKMNREKAIKDAFRTCLDSFAIVKSSFDPQGDFRDSMMEMITENEIRQREELEELLACYLTLNCDEYHGLIVKVFKDVCLELNQVQFDPYFQF